MSETTWKFYLNSDEAWEAMLADCAKAETSIDFEQFILINDEVGKRFFDLFVLKVKQGVKVRLLCDSAGSYSFYNSSFANQLKKEGIEIEFYNPISPWRLSNFTSWFFRDHKKILIVDSWIGYTGGVGVEKKLSGWRDSQTRIVGPVVKDMQYAFDRMWQIAKKGRFLKFRTAKTLKDGFGFITNSPHFRQRFFYKRLIRAIRSAKEYIYLTTPYFVPSEHFFLVLRRAAKRGVDVRLIVPQKSDHDYVDAAGSSYFGVALRAGIRIYQYKTTMMHTKTAVVDDNWATVGSANLDNLSLLFNYEAHLVSEQPRFIAQLKDHFVNDILFCDEMKVEEWQKRSLAQKVKELVTWPFHIFY